ncbi:MAG: radical SAM protein, partial [Thermotogota bacterium]|nr:radical SAM protein [Thermotogota bacterium]
EKNLQTHQKNIKDTYHSQKNIFVMTKSTLITRDIDLLKKSEELNLNITITTNREDVRRIFEPYAPPIEKRLDTVKILRNAGIDTNIFMGPVLPMNSEKFALMIKDTGCKVYLDPLNYPKLDRRIFYKYNWEKI